MEAEEKAKIRSIYLELQGYLSQSPKPKDPTDTTDDKNLWEQFNEALGELIEISGNKSYNRFRIDPIYNEWHFIRISTYTNSLGGLIAKLYADYFYDESDPFSGVPNTIITNNQHQEQNQSIEIEIAIEMTELITHKIDNYKEGTPERNFLEQIKRGLKGGKNVVELINLILETGANLGLSAAAISQLLS